MMDSILIASAGMSIGAGSAILILAHTAHRFSDPVVLGLAVLAVGATGVMLWRFLRVWRSIP